MSATHLDEPFPDELAVFMDEDSTGYWKSLRSHRLVLERCLSCERLRFPPMPRCPYCGSPAFDQEERTGHGSIYSYVRVHRVLSPEMRSETPYVVATVTLDDGPRVLARIEGDHELLAIDDRVRPVFVDHDGWTELRYEATGGERERGE